MIGGIGDGKASQVTDIFTQRQSPVHMKSRKSFERVVLSRQTVDQFLERDLVLGLPPVAQHALGIGFRALIVEAVPHLVPDHPAYATVIDCRIGSRIKERWLQDGRGKYHLVKRRVIVGIDRLWCHAPLVSIGGLIDSRNLPTPLK